MAKGKSKATLVSFLLDETYSMLNIKQPTMDGFNTYIDELKSSGHEYLFNLVKFNTKGIVKMCVGGTLKDVPRLSHANYMPDASTNLFDSIMDIIHATEEHLEYISKTLKKERPAVLLAIQTDGEENSSHRYSREEVRQKIAQKEEEGWEILYLGAGIDAYQEAQSLGIQVGATMSYGRERTGATFKAMAANTTNYTASGGVRGQAHFSDSQKLDSGDVHAHKYTSNTQNREESETMTFTPNS